MIDFFGYDPRVDYGDIDGISHLIKLLCAIKFFLNKKTKTTISVELFGY